MPDISLLQREYEVMQEEGRTPGVMLTVSMTALAIVVIAYVGFFFYIKILENRHEAVQNQIKELRVGDAAQTVQKLKTLVDKAQALAALRQNHRYTTAMFEKLERLMHPDVYFSQGAFDTAANTIKVSGTAKNSLVLARQVDIFMRDEKALADFSVAGIRYAEGRSIGFSLNLHFK